jgi:hypothetical protein
MMYSLKSIATALALASTLGLPLSGRAAPHPDSPIPQSARTSTPPPPGSVPRTFKTLYETWGVDLGVSVPAETLVAMDAPTTVKCAPTAGCTIVAETNAEIWVYTVGSQWDICSSVDGALMNTTCYTQDYTTHPGSAKGNDRANLHVATGTHTVQSFVISSAAMSLLNYQADYFVVTP